MPYPNYEEEKFNLFIFCLYGIVSLVGGGFLLGSAYEAHELYYRYKNGIVTNGEVTKVYISRSAEHEYTVYEVQFLALDRNTYTINNHYLTPDNLYRKGDNVSVIYEAEHPVDGRIENINEKTRIAGMSLLVGLLIISGLLLIYYKIHKPFLLRDKEL
jgi:hypothetical protein